MKNKIGIIGQGFVGTAVREGLKDFFNIETYDIAKESTCDSLDEICRKTKILFVCLPTPMKADGSCHIGIVEDVLEQIAVGNFLYAVMVALAVSNLSLPWVKKVTLQETRLVV